MIRHQSEEVEQARILRKQGISCQEISRELGISASTVRNWCFDISIDRHESLRVNNELRRSIIKKSDQNVFKSPNSITVDHARLFAALLYGCEGSKYPASSLVNFVNSDSHLAKVFITLLRKGFELEERKFRVHLQVHTSHNYNEVRAYWSNLLEVPEEQFFPPTVTSPLGKMRRTGYRGTCSIRYADYKIQLRLLGLFERFCDELA